MHNIKRFFVCLIIGSTLLMGKDTIPVGEKLEVKKLETNYWKMVANLNDLQLKIYKITGDIEKKVGELRKSCKDEGGEFRTSSGVVECIKEDSKKGKEHRRENKEGGMNKDD